MRTRRPRGRIDAQQRETPFFSRTDNQADVGAKPQEDFFQPKLTIGKPGDHFEQEADRAADRVINRGWSSSNDVTAVRKKEKVQRKARQEKDVQGKAELQRQPEEEEDTVQAQAEEEEEPVQAQAEEDEEPVQAQAEEEKETQAKPELQSKGGENRARVQDNSQDRRGGPALAARLQQQRGKGRPLPPEIRAEMEAALDADFGAVRIHTDEEAAQLSKMLGAQAFTHGNDIYFNTGRFNPLDAHRN